MKKILSLVLCLALLLSVAGVASAEGNVYSELYRSEVSTLNYLTTGTQWDQQVGANIVDTLVEYDANGKLIPGLAETWNLSEDGLTWTFNLRKGVKWYDYQLNEVAELTANDFVSALKYVLTAEYESSTAMQAYMVKNAQAYFNGDITDFAQVGVKALDDYTLEYTLDSITPYFLSGLTYMCFLPAYGPQLEELGKDFGTANDKIYYSGAFILTEFEPQVKHVYVKNENNWDADNIFLDGLEWIYNPEALTLAPTMVIRGEIDYALLGADIIDDWKVNHPDMITRGRAIPDYSYFYCFNFDPQYGPEYGPDNWRIAVNNASFRHSIMSAFDRVYAMSALDPDDPGSTMQNTVNPATFVSADGVDYTALAPFEGTEDNFYNEEKALAYKAAAIEELTVAGATFPVQMMLTYRSGDTAWENECILVKQQIEKVLGTDYIQVVLNAGPAESFLTVTRRAGMYSLMRCNWGADYQDPETWTDPFAQSFDESGARKGNSYNKMDLLLDSDYAETKATLEAYYAATDEAKASAVDMTDRYTKFATAEAMLINNAIVIPYYISPADYQVTKLNIFEGQFASFGMSILRFKGQKLYDHYLTPDEYQTAYDAWMAGMN